MSSLKSLEPDLALYDQDDDDAQDLKEALDALEPAIEISKPSGKSGDVKEAKDADKDKDRKDSKRAGAAVAPAKRGRVSFAPEREDKDSKEAKEKRAAEAKADAQQEDEGKKRDVNVLAFTSMRDVLDRVMLPSIKLRRRLVDYIVQTAKAGFASESAEKEFYSKALLAVFQTVTLWSDQSNEFVRAAIRSLAQSHTKQPKKRKEKKGAAATPAQTQAPAPSQTQAATQPDQKTQPEQKDQKDSKDQKDEKEKEKEAKRTGKTKATKFVQYFAAAFVGFCKTKALSKERGIVYTKHLFRLFRWSVDLLCAADKTDVESLSKFLPALIEAQCNILEKLRGDSPSQRARVVAEFVSILNKHDFFLPDYVKFIESAASPSQYLFSIHALASFLSQPKAVKAGHAEKYKALFVKWFDDHVLGARELLPPFERSSFNPFLRLLTHAELSSTLLPTLTRMLKRSPEVVMPTAVEFVRSLSVDLSRYVAELLPLLISELRHADEKRRANAVTAVGSLVQRVSDASVLTSAVQELGSHLLGKKETLSIWQLRTAFISAIESFTEAKAAGSEAQKAIATTAVDTLTLFFDKEGSAEAREAAVRSLARWISVSTRANDKTVALLAAGVRGQGKDAAIAHAYLAALLDVVAPLGELSDVAADSGLAALLKMLNDSTDGLRKHIDSAVAKPVVLRRLGLYASALLLHVASADQVEGALSDEDSKHAWLRPLLTDAKSFANTADAIAKCSVDEARAHALLFTIVVKRFHANIKEDAETFQPFFEGVVRALTHADHAVRRVIGDGVRAVLKKEGDVFGTIQPAFAASDAKPFTLWRKLTSLWRREKAEVKVDAIFSEQSDAFASLLLSDRALLSKQSAQREAACGLITTIASKSPAVFQKSILPGLLKLLDATELLSKSEYEQAVYHTKEGELCTWVAEGEYKAAKVVETKNVRHDRSRKGHMYKSEDEEWERKVREELEAKKAKGKAAETKVDEKTKAKLEEESGIREAMKALLHDVDAAVAAVSAVALRCPSVAHDLVLPEALPRLTSLLRNGVSSSAAEKAYRAVARCLSPHLREFSSMLSTSVVAVIKRGTKAYQESGTALMAPRVCELLEKAAETAPFSASSLMFALPLLSTSLLNSHDAKDVQPGREAAMKVLDAHCVSPLNPPGATVRFPVEEMIRILLHVLASLNEFKPSAHNALLRLAPSLRIADIDLLLGDHGLLSAQEEVRLGCLQTLEAMHLTEHTRATPPRPLPPLLLARLWLVCHDQVHEVAEQADAIWEKLELKLPTDYIQTLLGSLSHKEESVRKSAGLAIAGGCEAFPSTTADSVAKMIQLFKESPDEVIESQMGVRQEPVKIIRSSTRSGIAQAIGACVDSLGSKDLLSSVFTFIIEHGFADQDIQVWSDVLQSGLRIVEVHGQKNIAQLLPLFERQLDAVSKAKVKSAIQDQVREGIVVFLGTIARYLPAGNAKIGSVLQALVEVLQTPSHSVQQAAGQCISPLISAIPDQAERLLGILTERLSEGESYGIRKGAAFGLAAIVRGLKPSSLQTYGILNSLANYAQDKNNYRTREGAMFAYERLFHELKSTFEPYVAQILPLLLASFGDSNVDVRRATMEAANEMMSHLTGHGVKIILPQVLKGLEEKSWRSKTESVNLLGAMSHCAPKHLSICLPMIVPRLLEVMMDPNSKVQEAAKNSLAQIASVIRNPEISRLSPAILTALNDPSENTKKALMALMKTSFVHSIDPPSLALIIPILRRGLRDRVPATKKMAAQVVGCMCSLTADIKDILPYCTTLLKYLKLILVDPIPEVRAVAAKAMGSLYAGMGEAQFEGLLEWLLNMLKSDTNSVQRSGAAMGLSQVLHTLGVERTQELLPELSEETRHKEAVVREGYMGLFIYLPEAFGQEFHVFLPDVLPVVLAGLSDSIGPVREVALRAGQQLVTMFAKSHTELLLPALEKGVRDEDWRIRLATVQLLGTMLLRLAGAQGRLYVGDQPEDESKDIATVASRAQERLIEDVLGTARRNELYASIYLMRSDTMIAVRNMAWRVWKAVVQNTSRMLNEILPTLMNKIIYDLASHNEERQAAAGQALGDLVTKMGDYVLQQIIPILQDRLRSPDGTLRTGVCLGLSEVMSSAKKAHISAYMVDLIPAVRDALCDELATVRNAAGRAFQTLHGNVGKRAIDEIVPSLIEQLDKAADNEESAQLVLEGFREILAICSKDVLPYLIPELLAEPLTVFHAKALAALSDAFGHGFYRYVTRMVEVLVDAMSTDDEAHNQQMTEAGKKIVLCVSQDSVHTLVEALATLLRESENTKIKSACAQLIAAFCAGTQCSFESQLNLIMLALLGLFGDDDEKMQEAGVEALDSVVKMVAPDKLAARIEFVRGVVTDLVSDASGKRIRDELPALSLKKGLVPLLPVYQHALMNGSPELREQAAAGLGELIELTSKAALSPFVGKIAGPLIRIVGDRFAAPVKSAILYTLGLLIVKSGETLKPFVPQLQTTFVKSLQDPAQSVRDRGVFALAALMALSKRVDPVLTELSSAVRSSTDVGVKTSMLAAVAAILSNQEVGSKIAPTVIATARTTAIDFAYDERDLLRASAARCLAVCLVYAKPEEASSLLAQLLSADADSWLERDGRIKALTAVLELPKCPLSAEQYAQAISFTNALLEDDNMTVRTSAIACAGQLMKLSAASGNQDQVLALSTALSKQMAEDSKHLRQEVATQLGNWAEVSPQPALPCLSLLIPPLMARHDDTLGPVRQSVHRALYFLLQFHKGAAAADKLLQSYTKTLPADDAKTLVNFAKNTLARLKVDSKIAAATAAAEAKSEGKDKGEVKEKPHFHISEKSQRAAGITKDKSSAKGLGKTAGASAGKDSKSASKTKGGKPAQQEEDSGAEDEGDQEDVEDEGDLEDELEDDDDEGSFLIGDV